MSFGKLLLHKSSQMFNLNCVIPNLLTRIQILLKVRIDNYLWPFDRDHFRVIRFGILSTIVRSSVQLSMENERLKLELDDLHGQRGLLDDETVIGQIEQAFQQFNKFLDLLRDVG